VLTASPDELVEDIAKRLVFHNITGLPVLDWDDRVIGMVSEVDVIDKLGETIGDVMSTELTTVSRETAVEEIAALMTGRRIKRVPVIAEGMLVGIVSRADIVRAFAALSASSA
jgi:CBS domain-containing protein